jgi:hypothetical protein
MTDNALDDGFAPDVSYLRVRPKPARIEIPDLTFCNKQALERTISTVL